MADHPATDGEGTPTEREWLEGVAADRLPDPEPMERNPHCVERWPECEPNAYDPRCCRFPKSCSPVAADRLPDPAEEWAKAYDEAMQHRDWDECDRLLDVRDASDWDKPRPVSAAVSPAEPPEGTITHEEALTALNALRSNVVGTQSAGWSNLCYPLVAILNAAGFEQFDPTDEQLRQHMNCYGGAGGYPGRELREPRAGWCEPVGRLKHLSQAVRRYLADPTDENRGYLAANLRDEQ